MVYFIVCFVIFICELKVLFFLSTLYILNAFLQRRIVFAFSERHGVLSTCHFYHSCRGLYFIQESQVLICLFLPALWLSAFIIRATLEIFLILWVPNNKTNIIVYAGSIFFYIKCTPSDNFICHISRKK